MLHLHFLAAAVLPAMRSITSSSWCQLHTAVLTGAFQSLCCIAAVLLVPAAPQQTGQPADKPQTHMAPVGWLLLPTAQGCEWGLCLQLHWH